MLKKYKKNPDDVTVLDRLAIIGDSGMGALRYHPKISFPEEYFTDNLDELAAQCHKILNMEYSEKLEQLSTYALASYHSYLSHDQIA